MVEKLNPFQKLLKAETPINFTSGRKKIFDSVSQSLSDASESSLKQTFTLIELVLMDEVSFRSAEYAVIIEDNPVLKIQSKWKTHAQWSSDQKISLLSISKSPAFRGRNFLAIDLALVDFALFCVKQQNQRLSWHVTIQSHNSSKRSNWPALWNACD